MSWASRTVIWLRDFSMPRRSVEGPKRAAAVVVLGLPDFLARALVDLDRRVEHDAGRLVAVVERGRVDQRLEGGAGLALGLDGAVELAGGEREAAGHRVHAPGMRVHGDQAAADLRHLHQRPGAGRLGRVLGRHPDHVAGAQHVGHGLGRAAAGLAPTSPRRRGSRRPRARRQAAVGLARRAAGRRRPWSSAPRARRRGARAARRRDLDAAQRRAPVAGDVDLLHRRRASPCRGRRRRGRRSAPCAPCAAAWDRAWCAPTGRR